MSKYLLNEKCKHEGCNEWSHSGYSTQRALRKAQLNRKDYYCLRHKNPNLLLNSENTNNIQTTNT